MKLAIVTAVWQRPHLTRCTFASWTELIRQTRGADVEVVVAGSEGATSEALCAEFGFHHVSIENRPLGRKWNAAVQAARSLDVDCVIALGSDDFVTPGVVGEWLDGVRAGFDFQGVLDMYFLDLASMSAWHWGGYDGIRNGETSGAARCLSRALLDRLDWQPWEPSRDRGLDGSLMERIRLLGGTRSRAMRLADFPGDEVVLDVKSADNLTSVQRMCRLPATKVADPTLLRTALGSRTWRSLRRVSQGGKPLPSQNQPGSSEGRPRVVVTAAGSTNGVNVIKALRGQDILDLHIIAVDYQTESAGLYMADESHTVPRASDSGYVDALLALRPDVILPTYSEELPVLAAARARVGQLAALSTQESYEFTEDKLAVYDYLVSKAIPTPHTFTRAIIKQRSGSGSKGLVRLEDPTKIVQELIPGQEFTVDAVADLNGQLIAASPRMRVETRGGLATKSRTVTSEWMVNTTKGIIEDLSLVGPTNVQFIDGRVIEINNRLAAGGLPLAVAAGLNIPLIIVQMVLGLPIVKPDIQGDLTQIRYYDSVVVESQDLVC